MDNEILADGFTDGTVPEDTFSTDEEMVPIPGPEAVEDAPVQPPVYDINVPPAQVFSDVPDNSMIVDKQELLSLFKDILAEQAAPEGEDPSSDADALSSEEALPGEESPEEPAVNEPDYFLLMEEMQAQSGQLSALTAELQEVNSQISDIQNVFPVVVVLLGITAGILLLQVLASFLRP